MTRAIAKANTKYAVSMAAHAEAKPADTKTGSKEGIADLVKAMRAEETKVHIDLSKSLVGMEVKSIPSPFHPCSATTDKMATSMKTLSKKGVKKPFVYCSLRDFLPDWAMKVCAHIYAS
jgi:hypothetical protein